MSEPIVVSQGTPPGGATASSGLRLVSDAVSVSRSPAAAAVERRPRPHRSHRRSARNAPRPTPEQRVVTTDRFLRPTDEQLIREAMLVNHAQVMRKGTRTQYTGYLNHFCGFLAGRGSSFVDATRTDVMLYVRHLEGAGLHDPETADLVRSCEWCAARGFPGGRKGNGYDPSTIKGHHAAITFMDTHFTFEEGLPDKTWLRGMRLPKVEIKLQYTPTVEDVRALHNARGGTLREKLVCTLLYFVPTRRAPLSEMTWGNVDLERGEWFLIGKGGKHNVFPLHPKVLTLLRRWRTYVFEELAVESPAVRAALAQPETAPVLITRNGRALTPSGIDKHVKRRAIRAGVALIDGNHITSNAVPGKNAEKVSTRMSPHALRRAWADHAHNDPEDPQPMEVISRALNHADISTTQRHYVRTKPERARHALLTRSL